MEFQIASKDLKHTLKSALACVDPREIRKALRGVNFAAQNGSLAIESTDGKRLYQRKLSIPCSDTIEFNALGKSLKAACNKLKSRGTVEVVLHSDRLCIAGHEVEINRPSLYESDVEGEDVFKYPNLSHVIPIETTVSATMPESKAFLKSMKRASLLASKLNNAVEMLVQSGSWVVASESYDLGSYRERLDAGACSEADPWLWCANWRWLSEIVKQSESNLVMRANNPNTPILFDTGREGELWLLMPIKLTLLPDYSREDNEAQTKPILGRIEDLRPENWLEAA